MWIADGWKDYEVLDTSGGEKLERWGDYLLVRPDPQVIWNTKKENPGWKKKNGHSHRSSKGGGEWEFFHLPEQWEPVRLHGRRNARSGRSRRKRHTCRCIQRHGQLGKRERCRVRPFGQADPLACG